MSVPATIEELQQALHHRERQIEAMCRISEALFSQTSVDSLIKQTLEVTVETVGANAGSLQLHDPRRDVLVFRTVVGEGSEKLIGYTMPTTQGISGRVFRSGKSDLTSDVQTSRDFNRDIDAKTGIVTHSMATTPIKKPDGAPIGVMQILNFKENYDEYDLEVLEVLAGQAAIAIENARLQSQARKAAMVNFIGDISHDIKNMLTPIQTGVWTLDPMLREMFDDLDFLSETFPPELGSKIQKAIALTREEYEWILQNALDAAERVQVRTKEIADAVKGVSTPPRFLCANFNAVCEEVFSALLLVAHDAQLEFIRDLDENLPHVEFDHKQLYNALYNLVNNAIPETPKGGSITIKTRDLGPGESTFLVEVIDTGRGMTDEIRDRLFSDETISTKPGGTGLGTRIVADVVRRHNGHIAVQSEVGMGTTFTILLPKKQG